MKPRYSLQRDRPLSPHVTRRGQDPLAELGEALGRVEPDGEAGTPDRAQRRAMLKGAARRARMD